MYVPPPKFQWSPQPSKCGSVSDPTSSKIKEMSNRVLKRVESTYNGVKELKSDVSNLTQTVSSHYASIKNLKIQMNHLLAQMNPRVKCMVFSDNLPNLKNDGHV